MSDLREISRVIYRHDWTSVDQWASTLDQLADLTDDQIGELERLGKHDTPSPGDIGDRLAAPPAAPWRAFAGGRPSLGSWAHAGFWAQLGFWTHAVTSLRRGCRMISLF
jgi:hypothetical protein